MQNEINCSRGKWFYSLSGAVREATGCVTGKAVCAGTLADHSPSRAWFPCSSNSELESLVTEPPSRDCAFTHTPGSAPDFKGLLDAWQPVCGHPGPHAVAFSFFISIKRDIDFASLQELKGSLMNVKIHVSQVYVGKREVVLSRATATLCSDR